MTCRVSLFGAPRLQDGQGRPVPVSAKLFVLVGYLLLNENGAAATRAAVRQFLWGNSEPKIAAANLRKFLQRQRQLQERRKFELISFDWNHVELARSAEIDLVRFREATSTEAAGDIIRVCDIYRGDFLDGIELDDADARDWLRLQRTRLRDLFVSFTGARLAQDPPKGGVAIRIAARRLIEVDPYNESAHRALMQLFAQEGEPARVRDIYINLQQRLREDLGVDPDAATTELHRTLVPSWALSVAAGPPKAGLFETSIGSAVQVQRPATPDAVDRITAAPLGTPRVTILPPATAGGQDLSQQLASSLIEDVTIGLCRSKAISVVAPYSAVELSTDGGSDLLRSFGIDYSVETHLGSRAGEVWLSVKLLEQSNRRILWTSQYDLSAAETAQSFRSLSVEILTHLVERIERTELSRYDAEQHPTAYHLYLVGQRYLRRLDLPNIRRARRAFKSALNVCSEFVPALSGLARTLRLEWVLLARGDREQLVDAEKVSRRAIEIDPDDARGYRELGACTLYTARFDECLEAFGQAEARNPQFADLLVDFGDALIHACEPAVGIEKIRHAISLNPLCPDHYWWAAGGANFHLHRYQDAIDSIQSMRDQTPAYRLLAASFARLGERERAAEYVRRVMEIHPDFSVNGWLSILPIRDRQYERDYEQGLREAGFK
jgi:DNA-binding SARP family transcriptional activator/tetratricopeptide (TPR) repeat protein